MPRFSANLSMLFNELPFVERFSAAARAGFRAVEYVSPYALPKEQVAELLHVNTLEQALFNMPAGDWEKGERGLACLPGREGEFQASVGTTINYAAALGCKTVNCLAGILPPGVSREKGLETMAGNLAFAAPELKKAGVQLVIEPINFHDIPGFLLNTSKDGMAMIDRVGSDNLKLQYDIYHMQRMEGEIAQTLARLLPRIGHIQVADNPGRHEPGTGELNYRFLFRHLDALGYQGWVGAEYRPRAGTVEGLGWINALT
jgi:hydroxypyruvate isomerase